MYDLLHRTHARQSGEAAFRRIRLHKSVELEKKGFKWSAGLSVDDVWSASLHAQAVPSTPSCHVELINMTGR